MSLLLVLGAVLGGCASQRGVSAPARNTSSTIPVLNHVPAPAPAPGTPLSAPPVAPAAYTFSAGDEFDLRVPDAPQFDQTLRVRSDGRFSLALLGTVQALGRTPEQVEAELAQRLQRLAAPPGPSSEYLLHANDDIELKFPRHGALNEIVKIRPDGKIQLQMIGTVHAAGLSPEGLREVLLRRYARVLRGPDLAVIVRNATTQKVQVAGGTARAGLYDLQPTVIVRSFQAPQIFVGGEVLRPGMLAWRPGMTVIQAITESGWYLPSAEISKLMVLRRTDDNRSELLRPDFGIDLNGEQRADVALRPFDVVLLPKNSAASLADMLNLYVFNLIPPLRNSSLGFSYVLRDPNSNN